MLPAGCQLLAVCFPDSRLLSTSLDTASARKLVAKKRVNNQLASYLIRKRLGCLARAIGIAPARLASISKARAAGQTQTDSSAGLIWDLLGVAERGACQVRFGKPGRFAERLPIFAVAERALPRHNRSRLRLAL